MGVIILASAALDRNDREHNHNGLAQAKRLKNKASQELEIRIATEGDRNRGAVEKDLSHLFASIHTHSLVIVCLFVSTRLQQEEI